MVAIALYEPDIPQNTGTLMRLGACLGLPVHVIEPAGFRLDDRALRRDGMDYLERATIVRHVDWERFEDWRRPAGHRLVLATTRATRRYTDFRFRPGDIVLAGRESSGVPSHVHSAADARLAIPLDGDARSLNVALATAMIVGEALRQCDGFPV